MEEIITEITRKTAALPLELQREVLEFVESVEQRNQIGATEAQNGGKAFKSVFGILADRNINVSEEDITEMRREALRNFPREQPN